MKEKALLAVAFVALISGIVAVAFWMHRINQRDTAELVRETRDVLAAVRANVDAGSLGGAEPR